MLDFFCGTKIFRITELDIWSNHSNAIKNNFQNTTSIDYHDKLTIHNKNLGLRDKKKVWQYKKVENKKILSKPIAKKLVCD